jgi:hypothetical protein
MILIRSTNYNDEYVTMYFVIFFTNPSFVFDACDDYDNLDRMQEETL